MSAVSLGAIALGALGAGLALRFLARTLGPPAAGPEPRRQRRPSSAPSAPGQLMRIEQLVAAIGTAGDVHRMLRPLLCSLAATRLRRRGCALYSPRDGARARELLGEALWELVRPGRPAPADRLAFGISREQLSALLDALEAL